MPEQPPRAGAVLLLADRRIIVQAKPKIGAGELAIVDVRIVAEALKHRLGNRLEQRFVSERQAAKLTLKFRTGPIIFRSERALALLWNIERAPAPQPALDQIGMDVAGLLNREITLADGAV